MRGYKGTFDFQARGDITYEVGKKYNFVGETKMCEQGFHFCENPDNIFNHIFPYAQFDRKIVFLEIEAENISTEGYYQDRILDKKVCRTIKVLRVIPTKDYNKIFKSLFYDDKPIQVKKNNEEIIYSYDSDGKLLKRIFWHDSYEDFKYNKKGQLIKIDFISSDIIMFDGKSSYPAIYYYKKDKISKISFNDGREFTWEYDSDGRVIKTKEFRKKEVINKKYFYNKDGKIDHIMFGKGKRKNFYYKNNELVMIEQTINRKSDWYIEITPI